MVVVAFIILSVVELALITVSLATRSRWQKARDVARVATFAAFCLLVALAILPWSFRWLGLAALLFILAARATWSLLRPPEREARPDARRAVLRTLGLLLLYFVALIPALLFPPYRLPQATGPYAVDLARHTYSDERRREEFGDGGESRQVNVSFWYPRPAGGDELFPLIVFSHGGLGLETSNESLYHELASHGYVVASIGHPYHAFWTRSEAGRLTFLDMGYFRELQREDAQADKEQSYRAYQEWMATRTGDINLALDAILQPGRKGGGVYALVDQGRIGVMGHSLGGAAALALPRQRGDIDAVIALESPFLYEIVAVQDEQFVWRDELYPAPALNVYSDAAWAHLDEWPQYALNHAFLSAAPPHVFSLHLPGAGHFSLTDLSLVSPMLVRLLEGGPSPQPPMAYLQGLNRACLEFFDHYLKDKGNW